MIRSLWVYTKLVDPGAYNLFACVCICILEHGCVCVCLFLHLIRLLWVSTRLADAVALDTLVDLPRLTHLTEQRWDLPLVSTTTTSWLSYSTYLHLDFQFCSVTKRTQCKEIWYGTTHSSVKTGWPNWPDITDWLTVEISKCFDQTYIAWLSFNWIL